jgi:hypothetical protein
MENGPSEPPADGTCLFFKLSAELRNLVYQYALTDEHPLKFKRSGDGGELYTHLMECQMVQGNANTVTTIV